MQELQAIHVTENKLCGKLWFMLYCLLVLFKNSILGFHLTYGADDWRSGEA